MGFLCEIQTPDDVVGGIYRTLTQRRGIVISEEPIPGTPLVNMKAHLPVGESFGFTQALRAHLWKSFPTMCIRSLGASFWKPIGGWIQVQRARHGNQKEKRTQSRCPNPRKFHR